MGSERWEVVDTASWWTEVDTVVGGRQMKNFCATDVENYFVLQLTWINTWKQSRWELVNIDFLRNKWEKGPGAVMAQKDHSSIFWWILGRKKMLDSPSCWLPPRSSLMSSVALSPKKIEILGSQPVTPLVQAWMAPSCLDPQLSPQSQVKTQSIICWRNPMISSKPKGIKRLLT